MVFVAAGLVCGLDGARRLRRRRRHGGGGEEASREVVFLAAELALVLLLFADAARIDPRALRRNPLPARLLGIGLPLTVALGTLVGLVLLTGLELWECAIVAAVLAPTDAALGQAVISSPAGPHARARGALDVESGLNDGGSVPFLMLFIALAAAEEGLGGGWLRFAVEQIGFGALVGVAAGALGGARALRRGRARLDDAGLSSGSRSRRSPSSRCVAADEIGGNGFIAAFVAGSAAGDDRRTAGASGCSASPRRRASCSTSPSSSSSACSPPMRSARRRGRWLAYAVLSLTLIRMLPGRASRSPGWGSTRERSPSWAGSARADSPRSSSRSSSSRRSRCSPGSTRSSS